MEALEKLVGRYTRLQVIEAKVKSVSEDQCEVIALDGSKDFFRVSLNAVLENGNDKLINYPTPGSTVIIAIAPGATTASIIAFSQVDQTYFKRGTTVQEIDRDGFKLERDGESLKKVINDLIDEVNKIKVIYGNTINVAEMINIKLRLNRILK
jgi:hypothetical protein